MRHEWLLLDMKEQYKIHYLGNLESDPKLEGFTYLIQCQQCGELREIQESTFERMLSLGLLEL